jgi:uncharacterized protein
MNDIQANKGVCRQFFELVCAREYDRAMQLLHEDVEWWVIGDLPTSGHHHGRDAVTDLFALLRDNVPAGLKVNITALTAEEDRVAVEMNSEGVFPGDRVYLNVYHMLFWLRNGVIVKAHEYLDTQYTQKFLQG